MDIDKIKTQWRHIGPSPELVDSVDRNVLSRKRYKRMMTLTDKLSHRYFCSLSLCAVAPLLLKPLAGIIDLPLTLVVAYPAFFVIMFMLNLRLYLKLKKASVINLPVCDAFVGITEFAIMRRRSECVGISLAIPLMIYIIWVLWSADNEGLYIGGLVGAVIGGVIGLVIEIRTSRVIRRLKEDLRKNLDEGVE